MEYQEGFMSWPTCCEGWGYVPSRAPGVKVEPCRECDIYRFRMTRGFDAEAMEAEAAGHWAARREGDA